MVNPACRAGHIGVLGELARPLGHCLAERGGIALELPDDKHAHSIYPPLFPDYVNCFLTT